MMQEDWTKDGGPAFPVAMGSLHDQYACSSGLSKRDYFASTIMGHLIAAMPDETPPEIMAQAVPAAARLAYASADAMLKARKT